MLKGVFAVALCYGHKTAHFDECAIPCADDTLSPSNQTESGYWLPIIFSVAFFCMIAIQPEFSRAMSVEDVDASRRVDWAQAGYPGGIPTVSDPIITVTNQWCDRGWCH